MKSIERMDGTRWGAPTRPSSPVIRNVGAGR